jgi:Domain of Unknown Function (DUF1080)
MHLKISFACIVAALVSGCAHPKRNLVPDSQLQSWRLVVSDRTGSSDPIDPRFFAFEDGTLHVLGATAEGEPMPFAYLVTKEHFSNYRLRVSFRWGQRRFAPRTHQKRDAGVLVHVHGTDIVWPDAVELQIQEGDVGDAFTIDTQVTTRVVPGSIVNSDDMPEAIHDPNGVKHTQGKDGITRIAKSHLAERAGWNEVEVIACSDRLWFQVNGQLVNYLEDIRTSRPNGSGNEGWIPLTAGQIALQAEGAEIYYKDLSLVPIAEHAGQTCH